MKTKCYCVGCKHHPLHEKRDEFEWLTGWSPGKIVFQEKHIKQGVEVDCLEPEGAVFSILEKDDYDYPITAYRDGCALTGFSNSGMIATAYCKNEDHEN